MLAELTIDLLGPDPHQSASLGEILKVVDSSGLRYVLTPCGTCIEGGWDEVMALVGRCHAKARALSTHVITTVRIEDDAGAVDKLHANVQSVERAAGRILGRFHPLTSPEGDDAE